MAVLILTNSGGSDITLKYNDQLSLEFKVAGYFCVENKGDFKPDLPHGYCPVGTQGPFKPNKHDHDTRYSFEVNKPCGQQGAEGSHVIHTGSRL